MQAVEKIVSEETLLAYIIRKEVNPNSTEFITPSTLNLQAGFIVYPSGGEIARHDHRPLERSIVGTSEVLFVKKGRCEVDFYNDERQFVEARELYAGDTLLIVAGGHGFRMIEDTIFLEIKQGPYTGIDEKERF